MGKLTASIWDNQYRNQREAGVQSYKLEERTSETTHADPHGLHCELFLSHLVRSA